MIRPLPPNSIVMVAGVSFRQEAVRTVVEGDEVRVRHDVTNRHDPNACEVVTLDGAALGFVPRDLAPRLSTNHPGGVWAGRVVEVLRNDTWGLRVQIGRLLEEGLPDVGRTAPGLRHLGPGVVEAPGGALAVADPTPEPVAVPDKRPIVVARSGRTLGELLARTGGKVVVRNLAGAEATYPEAIVRIVA